MLTGPGKRCDVVSKSKKARRLLALAEAEDGLVRADGDAFL